MSNGKTNTIFSNRVYDKLKFVAQILLPAVGTLYFSLSDLWGLPRPLEVVGTITAIDLFLGTILGLSTNRYYKSGSNFDGEAIVVPEDGGNKVQFSFDKHPDDIVDEPGKHSIEMRIQRKKNTEH